MLEFKNTIVPLVILIVILVGMSSYVYGCRTTEMSHLKGFWETNNEFNEEAGLHLFSMYIGDNTWKGYQSYLLMIEDEEDKTILVNEPVEFQLRYRCSSEGGECREFDVVFKDLETELMPKKMSMKYYPSTCKIVLCDGGKVYAVFFKNPVLSEFERIKTQMPVGVPEKELEEESSSEPI